MFTGAVIAEQVRGGGNDPDAGAAVAGPHIGSWYNCPLCIKPCLGNLVEDFLERLPVGVRQEICNVFKDEELRLSVPSQADDFVEEGAARSAKSCLFSGAAEVLARESGCDDVIRTRGGCEGGYVGVDRGVGPMAVKYGLAVGVKLYKLGGCETADQVLGGVAEAAYTGKQV